MSARPWMHGLLIDDSEQRSEGWYEARRGAITGSRAYLTRERSDGLTAQQRIYVDALRAGNTEADAKAAAGYKAAPSFSTLDAAVAGTLPKTYSDTAKAYAMDLAREREGGRAPDKYQTWAMRQGVEQEPVAANEFEAVEGYLIERAGFIFTADKRFGASVDGLLGEDGLWECKTMVGSSTLFGAMVYGDVSEYVDQVLFELWLLRRKWCLLSLWCPDLQKLHSIRIERDEAAIQALEEDLMAFDALVTTYQNDLRKLLGREPLAIPGVPAQAVADVPAPVAPPWEAANTPGMKPGAIPASLFG